MKDKKQLRKEAIEKAKSSISKLSIISRNVDMVKSKTVNHSNVSPDLDDYRSVSCITNDRKDINQLLNIDTFNQKYQLGKKLGQGTSGVVRECLHLKKNKIYACKAMMFDDEHIPLLQKNFIDIRKLDHPNIVKYKALYLDLEKHLAYLVMEYIKLPSLLQYKARLGPSAHQNDFKWVFQELFKTLHHMHLKGVSHRDIKPDNIMINQEHKSIKIIDFGIAKKMIIRKQKIDMLTITGTLFYRAPQMFLGSGYNEKVDVWAAGITLFQILYGKTPFQSQYHSETIQNIQSLQPKLQQPEKDECTSYIIKDLLERLLRKNPHERFSAKEALHHLWFQKKQLRLQQRYSDVGHVVQTQYSKFKKQIAHYDPEVLKMCKNYSEIKKTDSPTYHRLEVDDI